MAVIEDGGAMPRRRFLKQALAGSIVAASAAHGRSPSRALRKYVREDGILSLAQAVQKMSGLAADHMGFADRGRVLPGQAAGLVLFDPDMVRDHASIETPRALSTGISRVWVNGELVWRGARATGALPGKTLLNRYASAERS